MLEEHLQETIAILQNNPLFGWVIAGVLALLFYFRPKDMFKLLACCVILAGALYFMSYLLDTVGSGSKQKDAMIYKTREASGE